MLYTAPELDPKDVHVLDEVLAMRAALSEHLRVPRRWTGRLRRTALARAIQGSNSIEGYRVDLDDADAALDDEEPLSADQRTFAEIRGYRQALGYVLAMATDEHFELDTSALRSMHFMMLAHDLGKGTTPAEVARPWVPAATRTPTLSTPAVPNIAPMLVVDAQPRSMRAAPASV